MTQTLYDTRERAFFLIKARVSIYTSREALAFVTPNEIR